jgi:hypothetical protein
MAVFNIMEQNCVNIVTVSTIKKRIYNQHKKLAKRLASEVSGTEFQKRLKLLNFIANDWKKNRIIEVDENIIKTRTDRI